MTIIYILITMRNLHDPRINWFRHAGLFYCVVDPKGIVLYLDELRYLRETRVWNSNELPFEVLAIPSDTQPSNDEGSLGETTTQPTKPPVPNSSSATGTSKDDKQNSPPIPRWKNWASKLVSSFRKWRNPDTKKRETASGAEPTREGGTKKLKFVGNLVLPNKGNFVRLLNDWQGLLVNLVGKPLFDARRQSFQASHHLLGIFCKNGLLYTVKYMKVSYIIVLKYLSGEQLKDSRSLGLCVSLRHGVPGWFPLVWRNWIRRGDISGIRFVLSWLYLYKAIETSVDPDLSTISAEPWNGDSSDFRHFAYKILKTMRVPIVTVCDLAPTGYTSIASGPNSSVISAGIRDDTRAWRQFEAEGNKSLSTWIELVQSSLFAAGTFNNHYIGYYNEVVRQLESDETTFDQKLKLGKLATFSDGGGKQRVVALPDFWTQLFLKPLHKILMKSLELFPQDATYDQDGKLVEFVARGYTAVYSLDLKAATDTIPQRLYIDVLGYIFGQYVAELWVKLLVDRDYIFSVGREKKPIRYTRGQPMGALSSWPAMALVHHVLVMYAASLAGVPGLFIDYLVLGDDVVIANLAVAEQYIKVCNQYGINLSLPKSFCSQTSGLLQFASQVYYKGVNVSPVSFKQELLCRRPVDRLAQAWAILSRWYPGEGISRLIRLMVPRSLWPEVSQSLSSGESHPLIQLIVRTLLVPGTLSSKCITNTRASILGFLSTYSGSFNLGRILTAQKGLISKPLERIGTLEATLLRSIIEGLCSSVYDTIECFKKALNMVDEAEHGNHVLFDFYFCSFNILMERQITLLDKFYPAVSRLLHRAHYYPCDDLPCTLMDLLDLIPHGKTLSNFVDDLKPPTQADKARARLISKYNLESSLTPKSLWRTITNFGLTVERITRSALPKGRRLPKGRKK